MSLAERFWAKVMPEPNSGCWLWDGGLITVGYGYIWDRGQMRGAHRISYEMHIGQIPAGMDIDHKCRVRSCVNPAHMEPVPRGENVRRGEAGLATGARHRAKTHCPHGHPYTGDNLRINRDGSRRCHECSAARDRRRRQGR